MLYALCGGGLRNVMAMVHHGFFISLWTGRYNRTQGGGVRAHTRVGRDDVTTPRQHLLRLGWARNRDGTRRPARFSRSR